MNKVMVLLVLLAGCRAEQVKNMKDLEQSMMDMKIYQENLGEHIHSGKLTDGYWLLEGLDSTLRTVAATIDSHHRMERPFIYYKEKWLDKPLDDLHTSFKNNDTAAAGRHYRLLVDRCNKCHLHLEIDEQVRY